MRSEKFKRKQKIATQLYCLFMIVVLLVIGQRSPVIGAIRDRVVAFVDDEAITLSELEMKYTGTKKITPDVTKEEVLNTMVNRLLLLREAKKIRLEAPTEDELLKEYIDLRVRAFIRIKEAEMLDFYKKNQKDFDGKEFEAVRDEIEKYLTEKTVNEHLKTLLSGLREKACVQIQLNKD